MNKKVVTITGANGFVGSSILKYLKNKDFNVIGLVRENSSLEKLKGYESNISKIDLMNVKSIEKAIAGSYCVIHCAARSLDWGRKKDFIQVNIDITENVANACKNKNIPVLVFISTANVAGYGRRMRKEEDSENSRLSFIYSKTKLIAEKKAAEILRQSKTNLIILRPSAIYGPGDTKWSFEMLRIIESGKWPIINGGKARFTPLFIGNLCHAVENTIKADFEKHKEHISIFNLTDDMVISWIDFCNVIADKLNVKSSYRNFPFFVALTTGTIIQSICWLTGYTIEPPLTIYRIIRAGRDFLYSCEKAKNEIGYNPDRNVENHIDKTVKWYRNQKKNKR